MIRDALAALRARRGRTLLAAVGILAAALVVCFANVHAASQAPVAAENGMVVTAQHLATRVGVDVLKDGGNAVDAAVAVGYALAAMLLGLAPTFGLAVLAAGALGVFDAITTTLRHAVVQLDTPDHLRGRVTSAYQMVSRGGPSLGQVQMGVLATALGAPLALGVGASATLLYTLWLGLTGTTVRDYTGAEIEPST